MQFLRLIFVKKPPGPQTPTFQLTFPFLVPMPERAGCVEGGGLCVWGGGECVDMGGEVEGKGENSGVLSSCCSAKC